MVIRPALPTDAQELALRGERLWRGTYQGLIPAANLNLHLAKTFGLAQQTEELENPACSMLVLEEGGGLRGYALLWARAPEGATHQLPFERPLEVARFYVDPALHGTGAAGQLMASVLAHAVTAGHDGVWLQVWEQNPRAISFYAKAGFMDVGETTFHVGDQVYRDRLLVHALTAQDL